MKFLVRQKPTAVILGSAGVMEIFGKVVTERGLRIPQDFSLICFDQSGREAPWLPGQPVTIVALPLAEMGRLLARRAREAAIGRAPTETVFLPCSILEGATVAAI